MKASSHYSLAMLVVALAATPVFVRGESFMGRVSSMNQVIVTTPVKTQKTQTKPQSVVPPQPNQLIPALPDEVVAPLPGSITRPLPRQIVRSLPGQVTRALPGQVVQPLPGQIIR
jgi:hypothetical protein